MEKQNNFSQEAWFQEYQAQTQERLKRNLAYMQQGVRFADIQSAYIDETVRIGAGTLIGPCVTLEGGTVIGRDCVIRQNTRIRDSVLADNVEVESSVILESRIGSGTTVGPFAYLRPHTAVGAGCKVGDFVEMKNSSFGDGSKAAHLTYVGDADVGKGVNLGCGVVFVNYDGTNKYRSQVGDDVFIGCNSNLVSPVSIGDGAYIAAGSTVTEDVETDALYIARSRGIQKKGWVSAKGIWPKKRG